MQQENGLDLLPGLRELGEKTDVIIISSASDVNTVQKALHYGVVDYLIKPFQFSRFKEALSHYRQQSQLLAQREFSQADVDSLLRRQPGGREQKLPKGLTSITLSTVCEWIEQQHDSEFSTDNGQRHRHFAGVLPQVPHLSGGERHSRHPYFVRRHRPPGLSVSAEAGRDRHAERALPPGITTPGAASARTLKAEVVHVTLRLAVRIFRVSPQAALLFCCCSGDAAAAWRSLPPRAAVRAQSPARWPASDYRHSTPCDAMRRAFSGTPRGLYCPSAAPRGIPNPPAPAQSRRNTGRAGQH